MGLNKSASELKTHKDLDDIDDREDSDSGEDSDDDNDNLNADADDTGFKVMDGDIPYTYKTEEDIKDFFSGDLMFSLGNCTSSRCLILLLSDSSRV